MKVNIKEIQTMYRSDLRSFAQFAFPILNPNKELLLNWHLDVMADELTRCYLGDTRRLIMNVPPRYLKTQLTSVMFVAWTLGLKPETKFMVISYGDDLVRHLTALFQKLIESDRYRMLYPHIQVDKSLSSGNDICLASGGGRLGVSVGGAITGRGADKIIIDDPSKASDMHTKERENVNTWYDENVYQRLDNKNKGVIILIMQRLHLYDLTGYLRSKPENWRHCSLKAIAESDESYKLLDGRELTRKSGTALHPEHESLARLQSVRLDRGSYVFQAQYQQDPKSDEVSPVRAEDFQYYEPHEKPERFDLVIQSWDTGFTDGKSSGYTAGITIGQLGSIFYILGTTRFKKAYSEIRENILTWYGLFNQQYTIDRLIIEKAASGYVLEDELSRLNLPLEMHKPQGSKFIRFSVFCDRISENRVYLPKNATWVSEFVDELSRFPQSQYSDQVDAFSQAMYYFQDWENNRRDYIQLMRALDGAVYESENARIYHSFAQRADPRYSDKKWFY
jgi:predicted phage terminase large subunit-like protein